MGEHVNELGSSEFYIVEDDGGYKELGKIKDVEIETTGSEDLYSNLKIPESSEFSCSVRICKPLKLYILMFGKIRGVVMYARDTINTIKRRFRK